MRDRGTGEVDELTMGKAATFATTMQSVRVCTGRARRAAALAAGLALLSWALASGPAVAQVRPGAAPDAIDRSRDLSSKPMPTLPAAEQPTERLVPESRQRDPRTGGEFVTPPRYERSSPDRSWQAPPPATFAPPGESPPRLPGR